MKIKNKTSKTSSKKLIHSKNAFLLDTNVLVHDPFAIFAFSDANIFLPVTVLEEMDRFKKEGTDRGRNTRQFIKQLDLLREKGNLGTGIMLDNNSIVTVMVASEEELESIEQLRPTKDVIDNRIISYALLLQQRKYDVQFVSKDLNARVKADVFGIHAIDYTIESIPETEIFRGFHIADVPAVELTKEEPKVFDTLKNTLLINEFVMLRSQHNPYNFSISRFLGEKAGFKQVPRDPLHWTIKPKNSQQIMALDLLLDPEIQLVSLVGPAGTGKTFLALLAGLYQVLVEHKYEKMLISRPVIPLGRDIGYLPGTMEEKLHSWMLPIYDNMDLILHELNVGLHQHNPLEEYQAKKEDRYKKRRLHQKRHGKQPDFHEPKRRLASMHELMRTGKIGLEAITYMRGRSIPFQFIVIDEAQNLSHHEVKTLVTRAGEGSKIILTGDPYQIDSPISDFSSNGIMVCTEKFKGNSLFGTVFLDISERSTLSQVASELL
jgi:PhoH-like ATPase